MGSHHNALADAMISNGNKSGTRAEALQRYPNIRTKRQNSRVRKVLALGQTWTHSLVSSVITCVASIT